MPIQPIPSSLLAEAAHYGREGTDQGTVPLYPIAHVLALFDQQVRIVLLKTISLFFQPFSLKGKGFPLIASACRRAHDGLCKPPG